MSFGKPFPSFVVKELVHEMSRILNAMEGPLVALMALPTNVFSVFANVQVCDVLVVSRPC
jgi:hypothetical protein